MKMFLLMCIWAASAVLAQPQGSWINVRDWGATGSSFQTKATLTAGSKEIRVENVGDFKPGQGVMISRADIQISKGTLWGPKEQYAASKPLGDIVQIRGYDGSLGSWTIYLLDIDGANPPTFRWSDDLGRTWKQTKVPITYDWQPLNGGTEIKFGKLDWEKGYAVTFSVRDQLLTVIEKIEGNKLIVRDAPTRSATDAVVRHNDTEALQNAINQAIKEKRNVFFPPGHYMLARPLLVQNAAGLVLEGLNGVDTVLDISEGEGACINVREGVEVTIRNFRMLGNMGFAERDQAGHLPLLGAGGVWGFYLKSSHAVTIANTERVLIENCHASRMSGECFYSAGRSRQWNRPEPAQYTKAITYLRCSVTDCARNAFNNNDMAENTSVLYCRIVDVGGCAWEGASRFVRFIGNYVRNAGTVAMGNIRSRAEQFEQLGSGQHIIADNVFEGNVCYGGAAIRAAAGASQIVIRDNLFVNFNSSALDISGVNSPRDLTAGIATISGNIFDMTDISGESKKRTALLISGSHVMANDNQIYVRQAVDPNVTAIEVREPAVNVHVHHNLIRHCGVGLAVRRASARVVEIISPTSFTAMGTIPLERRQSHRYQGWGIAFWRGNTILGQGLIHEFDPETCQFHLEKPLEIKPGDIFEVYPRTGVNWDVSHNTITDCLQPVVLDGYGSPTSRFAANIISCGAARVKEAVILKGLFHVLSNHFSGFEDKESVALSLYPDRFGKPIALYVQNNIFDRCAHPVGENAKGLWEACQAQGNIFIHCAEQPAQKAEASQKITAILRQTPVGAPAIIIAAKLTKPITLDGDVSDWPWKDTKRIITLQQDPQGSPVERPQGKALAAWDGKYLYLAVRATILPQYQLTLSAGPYSSDGMELAFQSGDPAVSSPIFVLWGGANGKFSFVPVDGGVNQTQSTILQNQTRYAAKIGKGEWTAEWRLPLAVFGSNVAKIKRVRLNIGLRYHAADLWVAWRGTGAELFRVERAGIVQLP